MYLADRAQGSAWRLHWLIVAVAIATALLFWAGSGLAGEQAQPAESAVGHSVVLQVSRLPGQEPVRISFAGRSGQMLWQSGGADSSDPADQGLWRGSIRYLGEYSGYSTFEATEFSLSASGAQTIGFLAKTPGRVMLPFLEADLFLIVEAVDQGGIRYHLEATPRKQFIDD